MGLIVLEELALPSETSYTNLPDLKKEPFESINPNGSLPDTKTEHLLISLSLWVSESKRGLGISCSRRVVDAGSMSPGGHNNSNTILSRALLKCSNYFVPRKHYQEFRVST